MRKELLKLIAKEIKNAKEGKQASILFKMNSLSDEEIIESLYEAAKAGVELKLIVRGIFCMYSENKKFVKPVQAISIVDEYLEHARVYIFHNDGNEKVFISSADLMLRNLDHRVEATCPILDENIKKVLKTILEIQLNDNVKARILDNDLSNWYVRDKTKNRIRSQVEIYNYLYQQTLNIPQTLKPTPMVNPLIADGLEIITAQHETGSN
jgi:polyphosphate kinase